MTKKRVSITVTSNYNLFNLENGNRDVNLGRHRKLLMSMKKHGFLSCFPIVCVRNQHKKLIVRDGQHRLACAEKLGLSVAYIVVDDKFDIALINGCSISWTPVDYAKKWAAKGKADYAYGLEFAATYGLPIAKAFFMLYGKGGLGNSSLRDMFQSGNFVIGDKDIANSIAATYISMTSISALMKTSRFLEALIAVCGLKGFEPSRLLHKAKLQSDRLLSYSTKDAYIDMIEDVYNYKVKADNLVPLAMLARQATQVK